MLYAIPTAFFMTMLAAMTCSPAEPPRDAPALRATALEAPTRMPAVTADTILQRAAGVYVAEGVSFQSGRASGPFEVRVTVHGDRLLAVVPGELALAGGRRYLLAPLSPTEFEHEDDEGRRVRLELTGSRRALLVITGSGGSGVVTFQLTKR
jgi:hypothetical protein